MHVPTRGFLGAALVAVLLVAGGCATSTPYQPLSAASPATGGYTDQRLAENRFGSPLPATG